MTSSAEDWAVEWGGIGCRSPWTLAVCGPERMITRERWYNLDHQAVVLRRGPQLLFLAAAGLPDGLGPPEGLKPSLALARVDDMNVQVVPALIDGDRIFRASALVDSGAYLASIEVVGQDDIGRARFGAPAPTLLESFGVSNLALLDSAFDSVGLSLEEALLPSLDMPARGHLTMYFEVYGLSGGEDLEFTFAVEKSNPSFLRRLARFFRLASAETRRTLVWRGSGGEEPGVTPRVFDIDLSNLDEGRYTFTLGVVAGEGKRSTVSRQITLR